MIDFQKCKIEKIEYLFNINNPKFGLSKIPKSIELSEVHMYSNEDTLTDANINQESYTEHIELHDYYKLLGNEINLNDYNTCLCIFNFIEAQLQNLQSSAVNVSRSEIQIADNFDKTNSNDVIAFVNEVILKSRGCNIRIDVYTPDEVESLTLLINNGTGNHKTLQHVSCKKLTIEKTPDVKSLIKLEIENCTIDEMDFKNLYIYHTFIENCKTNTIININTMTLFLTINSKTNIDLSSSSHIRYIIYKGVPNFSIDIAKQFFNIRKKADLLKFGKRNKTPILSLIPNHIKHLIYVLGEAETPYTNEDHPAGYFITDEETYSLLEVEKMVDSLKLNYSDVDYNILSNLIKLLLK